MRYQSTGATQTLAHVAGESQCGTGGGWYYDDPTTPTAIQLCSSTCMALQTTTTANVSVDAGCQAPIL